MSVRYVEVARAANEDELSLRAAVAVVVVPTTAAGFRPLTRYDNEKTTMGKFLEAANVAMSAVMSLRASSVCETPC